MAIERTLTIIKPDAVQKGVVGRIVTRFEEAGLRILAARLVHLTPAQAAGFYIVHRERPFYASLCRVHDVRGPASRWSSRATTRSSGSAT